MCGHVYLPVSACAYMWACLSICEHTCILCVFPCVCARVSAGDGSYTSKTPSPEGPTSATVSPGLTSNDTLDSTGSSGREG